MIQIGIDLMMKKETQFVNTNLQCYAILHIQHDYGYVDEFFNCMAADFDTNNIESLVAFFKDVYKIEYFDIYWTILDPDHFCEIHEL